MGKEKFVKFFFKVYSPLKFGKINSGFTLTEQWEAGNYYIVFWCVTSKAEISTVSPAQFQYIALTTKF